MRREVTLAERMEQGKVERNAEGVAETGHESSPAGPTALEPWIQIVADTKSGETSDLRANNISVSFTEEVKK